MSSGGADETRGARRASTLADALWTATAEAAHDYCLSEGCVVEALTLLLGKVAGRIAQANGHDLAKYTSFIIQEFRKVAWAEHRRRPWPIQ